MRGEHSIEDGHRNDHLGSSPHAWGTHDSHSAEARLSRFIPTCVGNTLCLPSAMMPLAVHPHMRGEHPCMVVHASDRDGSSPHAWGTHLFRRGKGCHQRFIPTCVGNTCLCSTFRIPRLVHPHMR